MSAKRYLVPDDLSKVLRKIMRWKLPSARPTGQCGPTGGLAGDSTRIGICVSGGPDSMALAHLLHNMDHPYNPGTKAFSSHAFIVDHEMRPESGKEASQVQHNLRSLGMCSTILNIRAVKTTNCNENLPRESQGKTETVARVLRYHAIVKAARRNGISQLFLGHHHDDQMETILMKLVMQEISSSRAFVGIPSRAPAPYSSQIFGGHPLVHHTSRFGLHIKSTTMSTSFHEDGIECIRPLLAFTKDQLVATCKIFDIPFVSDRTNHDPTYTLRNAIRHLRSHARLPRALQDTVLQKLQASAIQKADCTYEAAKQFSQKMQILHRYPESGMATVSFGELPGHMTDDELRAASLAMARLSELVSPISKDILPLELPPTTTKSILNMSLGLGASTPDQSNSKVPHCLVSKVDFRSAPAAVNRKIAHKSTQVLQVSRQAMRRAEIIANTQSFVFEPSHLPNKYCSTWLCWDWRFWIQVKTRDIVATQNAKLTIRPYRPEDVASVRKRLQEKGEWIRFEQMLNVCAPGHVRYTMPVLVSGDQVVAFPTCDIQLVDSLPFQWNVAYPHSQRSVDFFWPDSARQSQQDIP
ncbi:hypothetical protein H2198_004206 [Neophaeococcomyces mojaviensis]|uniref:Uncharacterized protein n=1 Tax=Neophaeococcomyces mojaviensis TaxID=3383035 RepID=A0ACC3A9K0_9EURO|nr:hypothetical protein H2198_004206 [Knufia sp. JES_112]